MTLPALPLAERLKRQGLALGFRQVGIVAAAPAATHGFYRDWLASGYAGTMAYLHRHGPLKADPARLLPGAKSLVLATLGYRTSAPALPRAANGAVRGRVARYAWGRDYHEVVGEKLARLGAWLDDAARREQGRPVAWRAFVDTSPVMEREFAVRAGLGWVGKNANLIHWDHGSWLFIAGLLVDLPLDHDVPVPVREANAAALLRARESCGTCTACMEACPTAAIVADKTVDARRCVSYLTIELKGPIPAELRPGMGGWVFGCDVCQDVCPWNRPELERGEASAAAADVAFPALAELLGLGDAAFKARFGHSPLARPRRRGLLRNAAIALGNALADLAPETPGYAEGVEALRRALGDPAPLVRGAAAWALGRASASGAGPWLRRALDAEPDPGVQDELRAALATVAPAPHGEHVPLPSRKAP